MERSRCPGRRPRRSSPPTGDGPSSGPARPARSSMTTARSSSATGSATGRTRSTRPSSRVRGRRVLEPSSRSARITSAPNGPSVPRSCAPAGGGCTSASPRLRRSTGGSAARRRPSRVSASRRGPDRVRRRHAHRGQGPDRALMDSVWQAWLCCHLLDLPGAEDRMNCAYATCVDGLAWDWHGTVLEGRPGEWDARGARLSRSSRTVAPPTTAVPVRRRTGRAHGLAVPDGGHYVSTGEPVADVRYLEVLPLPAAASACTTRRGWRTRARAAHGTVRLIAQCGPRRTDEGRGHVDPLLPFAEALAARGDEVASVVGERAAQATLGRVPAAIAREQALFANREWFGRSVSRRCNRPWRPSLKRRADLIVRSQGVRVGDRGARVGIEPSQVASSRRGRVGLARPRRAGAAGGRRQGAAGIVLPLALPRLPRPLALPGHAPLREPIPRRAHAQARLCDVRQPRRRNRLRPVSPVERGRRPRPPGAAHDRRGPRPRPCRRTSGSNGGSRSEEALAQASLVVCHGGSGTVLGALAAAMPLI